ncbi:MAG: alpha/beta hydrolase [Verrucomicrobiales bacterium]|nr:alpha/beta hydrolase [Verrucomicrobiales bacterium]
MAGWTRNRVKNLIGLALAPFVAYGLLRWFEHRQVFQPSQRFAAEGDSLGVPFQEVWLTSSDGVRLNAWFFPTDPAQPAVIVCHGNGGNISHRLDLYTALRDLHLNVLAFDYRGYGRSEGRPSETGVCADAEAACHWLEARGFAATNLLALGESLGGGVATELAVRRPLGGLILQSTFTSIPDIGAEFFPWLPVRTLATIHFDNRAKLSRLHLPLLVMHSRTDTIIPFAHGQRLFAAANAPKLFRELRGDHNDTLQTGRLEFTEAVRTFLDLRQRPPTDWPTATPTTNHP